MLSAGTRLGPYEVAAQIGEGGMGQVYRARDIKLDRDVAIKILPESFSHDADRLARFTREAKTLASLNHPNIAAIYGLEESGGMTALVMELVEGEDLSKRIEGQRAKGSGLPIDEALPIAKQIADALEAAHERGIIHRDLKPANIKITPDGAVKVLDFGLAKVLDPDPESAAARHIAQSPTVTVGGTTDGVILGTAAYMSPEQARGKPVDKRTDIWAFGCVLYEMLTGRVVFPGATISDTIAAILEREPEWGALPPHTPAVIEQLLRRCLDKDPKRRLHDVADARIEIDDARSAPPSAEGRATPGAARSRERIAWLAALGVVTVIAAVLAVRAFPASPAVEMRVDITTPPTTDLVSLAISPDGQKIVFVATSEARSRAWLRSLNATSSLPLEGTDGASLPFWSPDSRSVGFFADGRLKRIDIAGGSATVLANAPYGRGGAWNGDGTMLFVPNPGSPILKIPATGGQPSAVTQVEMPTQQHQAPHFLPDGRHFLYYVVGAPDASGVYIGDLGGSNAKRLLPADSAAVYASSGQLLFVRRGTLFAQDFDPVRLALGGNSFPVAEHVAVQGWSAALSVTGGTGPIVYRTGSAGGQQQLAWFDQSGTEVATVGDPDSSGSAGSPSFSPDGRRVAVHRAVGGNMDIYLLETTRAGLNRFTVDAADDIFPLWSPDGARIVFSSTRKGGLDLYLKSASGIGNDELLLATPDIKVATSWSPDSRFLLYFSADPKTGFDIWALPMDAAQKPFPVIHTKSNERLAQFSPDGEWIAYESDESGRYEIYVQPWSGSGGSAGGKVPISTTGGAQVRWGRDGKAVFYIALDDRLMTVPIRFASNGRDVEPGTPVPLFATRVGGALQPFPRNRYTISPDGQRFLMNVEREGPVVSPITVLLNWAGRNR